MELREIRDSEALVSLNPDDLHVLAAACELACIAVGGSCPDEGTLTRLHVGPRTEGQLSALASAFSAAQVAAYALFELPTH